LPNWQRLTWQLGAVLLTSVKTAAAMKKTMTAGEIKRHSLAKVTRKVYRAQRWRLGDDRRYAEHRLPGSHVSLLLICQRPQ